MGVENGDRVIVSYEGKLDDGTIFDASYLHEGKPLNLDFVVGAGDVMPALERAVIGMNVGEEREFDVSPEEGYGEHKQELIQEIPKDLFPDGFAVRAGSIATLTLPSGKKVQARILDVNDVSVVIDFNEPLAGKTLHFAIKLIAINPSDGAK